MNELLRRLYFPLLTPEGETTSGDAPSDTPKGGEGDTQPNKGGGGDESATLRARIAALEQERDRERSSLGELRESLRLATRPGAEPDKVERATRRLLAESGYSASEIEQYLQDQKAPPEQPAPRGNGRTTPDPEDEGGEGEEDSPLTRRIRELEEKLEHVDRRTGAEIRKGLEIALRNESKEALTGNKELGTLIQTLFPDDEAGDRKASSQRDAVASDLREMVEQKARAILAKKKAETGTWDDRWIKDASKEAATFVYEKYRRMVPDPSKIKGSINTDEFEAIRKTKPVDPPKYERGEEVDVQLGRQRRYAEDRILRAAASVMDNEKNRI